MSADERRRLARLAARMREGLDADREAGITWLPLEGPSAFDRLAAPSDAPSSGDGTAAPAVPAPAADRLPRAEREARLAALAERIAACTACGLAAGRTRTVPGEGDPEAGILFVGEGPGQQEDESGRPFVGRAGRLLRKLITEQLGRDPSTVFIANIVKCRPPGNRAPKPDESEACLPFLRRQVAILRPRIIVTLGNPSTQALLKTRTGITRLHGQPVPRGEFLFYPTFHPSYLLRNQRALPDGEEDFRRLRGIAEELGV